MEVSRRSTSKQQLTSVHLLDIVQDILDGKLGVSIVSGQSENTKVQNMNKNKIKFTIHKSYKRYNTHNWPAIQNCKTT